MVKRKTKAVMKNLSVADILRMGPCEEYSKDRIKKLWAGRKSLTPLEILDMGIPIVDRFWAVLRPEVIGGRVCGELACDFAEHVLHIWEQAYPEDLRPHKAIETKRKHLVGQATDEELRVAGNAAAAAGVARGAAEWGAATNAASAAGAVVWAAAGAAVEAVAAAGEAGAAAAAKAAEESWQLERVREVLAGKGE